MIKAFILNINANVFENTFCELEASRINFNGLVLDVNKKKIPKAYENFFKKFGIRLIIKTYSNDYKCISISGKFTIKKGDIHKFLKTQGLSPKPPITSMRGVKRDHVQHFDKDLTEYFETIHGFIKVMKYSSVLMKTIFMYYSVVLCETGELCGKICCPYAFLGDRLNIMFSNKNNIIHGNGNYDCKNADISFLGEEIENMDVHLKIVFEPEIISKESILLEGRDVSIRDYLVVSKQIDLNADRLVTGKTMYYIDDLVKKQDMTSGFIDDQVVRINLFAKYSGSSICGEYSNRRKNFFRMQVTDKEENLEMFKPSRINSRAFQLFNGRNNDKDHETRKSKEEESGGIYELQGLLGGPSLRFEERVSKKFDLFEGSLLNFARACACCSSQRLQRKKFTKEKFSVLLTINKSKLNEFDQFGNSAIFYLVQAKRNDLAVLLMNEGVDLKKCNDDFRNLLHVSSFYGNKQFVDALLSNEETNYLKNEKDKNGKCPWELYNDPEILNLFIGDRRKKKKKKHHIKKKV